MAIVDATQPAQAATVERAARRRRQFPLFAYLCILPAVLFAAVFLLYPSLSAIAHSFTDWDGASAPTFIGLSNFQQMLSDPQMRLAFGNVGKITIFALLVELSIPLLVAKLVLALRSTRFQHVARVMFLLPLIVPQVVIYLLWQFIYDPNVGLLNSTLHLLHLGGTQDWLGDPAIALYSVMATGAGIVAPFPFVDGFALLIFTAGLQAIPGEVIEAAHLDGAGAWARFWRVEVPLILGQLRLISVLTIIASIQQYTAILILTGGGPGFATYVPGYSMYNNAFAYNHMGYACAIGTVLFLIILALTAINLRYIRPTTEYDANAA
jgi:raffinose/stachyose/melibiose transport system permease protein